MGADFQCLKTKQGLSAFTRLLVKTTQLFIPYRVSAIVS